MALWGCSDGSEDTDGEVGTETSGETTGSETGETDDSDGTESTGNETDSDTTEGPTDSESESDSDTTTTGSPWVGDPLPDAAPGEWNWIDFPDSRCRTGTSTGIGVRYGSVNKVMIYFQGGGACFNTTTCALNPSSHGQADFVGWSAQAGQSGIFNSSESNPTHNWSHIFIPYCTGDVHFGSNPGAQVPGVAGTHEFVGFDNVSMFLERIGPTFPDPEHVLVAGESAGGFGAALNYDRIADGFGNTTVTLLDDSGPPLSDTYLHSCLQKQWRELWGFDDTLPMACDGCFGPDGGGIYQLAPYLAAKHGEQKMALISATADNVIRLFFGYGITEPDDDPCGQSLLPPSMEPWFFEDGLYDFRDNILDGSTIWGSYFIESSTHTWIGGGGFFETEVSGKKLNEWVRDLLEGTTSHVNP